MSWGEAEESDEMRGEGVRGRTERVLCEGQLDCINLPAPPAWLHAAGRPISS